MVSEIIFRPDFPVLQDAVDVGQRYGQDAVDEPAIVETDAFYALDGAQGADLLHHIVLHLGHGRIQELVRVDVCLVVGEALPFPVHIEPVGMRL